MLLYLILSNPPGYIVAGITGGVFTEPEDQYAIAGPGVDAEFVCNNTNSSGPVGWRIKSYDLAMYCYPAASSKF